MNTIYNKTVAAGTLVEVIVAMVITVAVFTTGLMIYFNVTGSSYTIRQVYAASVLERMAQETKITKSFFTETIEHDNLIIHKSAEPYGDTGGELLWLYLEARDQQDKKLAEYQELIEGE